MIPIRSPLYNRQNSAQTVAFVGATHSEKIIQEIQDLKNKVDTAQKELDKAVKQAKDLVQKHTEQAINEMVFVKQNIFDRAHKIQKGDKGEQGEQGVDGRNGVDGIGIVSIEQPDLESVRFIMTDGTTKELKLPRGLAGEKGIDGKDAEPVEVQNTDIAEILNQIVEKQLLSVDHIRGLPERLKEVHSTARTAVMRGGGDTVKAGAGISISRTANGVSIISTSGTGTKVRDEEPSGSGTSFTLAHTPIANTLQLYRGGIRIQQGAGKDYTLSGNTITLSSSLSTGEVLLADYEYV